MSLYAAFIIDAYMRVYNKKSKGKNSWCYHFALRATATRIGSRCHPYGRRVYITVSH